MGCGQRIVSKHHFAVYTLFLKVPTIRRFVGRTDASQSTGPLGASLKR